MYACLETVEVVPVPDLYMGETVAIVWNVPPNGGQSTLVPTRQVTLLNTWAFETLTVIAGSILEERTEEFRTC